MARDLDALQPMDVVALARLHRAAFPGFFLSTLGEAFLVQFYRGFLDDPTAVTVVLRDDAGSPLGSAVGTTEPARFFRRLVRRRLPGFVSASVRSVISNPTALPRLLRAVRYRGDVPSGVTGTLLSSICVDPCLRGSGPGHRLLDAWEESARAAGSMRAFLVTDALANDDVNCFYAGRGWELQGSYATREGRTMNRYSKTLGQA